MQLTQIIRQAPGRTWALALIPALALTALVFLVTFNPASHTVTATIGVTAPSGPDTAATVTQAVDSFRSALTTGAVRDAAAEEVGLDGVAERDVASRRVGASSFVEVEVSTSDPDDLRPLVLALIRSANELAYTPARSSAQAQEESARESFEELRAEFEEASPDGSTLPVHKYQAKAAEVTQLRVALAGARARGGAEAAGLEAALERASRELTRLGDQVRALDQQSVPLQRARIWLEDTTTDLAAIEAGLAAANGEGSVKFGAATEESQATILARAVVAGLVVGVAVAVGFVLLMGAFGRGGHEREGRRRT